MHKISEFPNLNNSCVQSLNINDLVQNLFIKRDDLIHPIISGNKWRKLKYNLLHVEQNNLNGIITFGGAFSNHLLAVAYASKIQNIHAVGIVRGDELTIYSNSILSLCHSLGMELKFVSRETYSLKNEPEYKQTVLSQYPNYWIIPEGGSNYQGIIGCMEIMKETKNDFDFVCVSQGTTATSLGILLSIPAKTKLIVCPALKGFDSNYEMIKILLKMGFESDFIHEKMKQVLVLPTDGLGKYGKVSTLLKRFCKELYEKTEISFDYTYNTKSLYLLNQYLVESELLEKKVLYIHTGGFS